MNYETERSWTGGMEESQGCYKELVGKLRKKALLTCFKILEHQLKKLARKKKTKTKSTWKVITAITPLLSLSLSLPLSLSLSPSLSLCMLHTLTAAFNSDDNPTELCFCLHVFLSAVVLLLLLQLQSSVKL